MVARMASHSWALLELKQHEECFKTGQIGGRVMTSTIDTDYLVIGAGAMATAFSNTLVSETDATVVLFDRYHQLGGHWITAYPFLRLHQRSTAYRVNSRPLGSDTIDRTGWNLYELATNGEVCAY
jgi:hypothetical protein